MAAIRKNALRVSVVILVPLLFWFKWLSPDQKATTPALTPPPAQAKGEMPEPVVAEPEASPKPAMVTRPFRSPLWTDGPEGFFGIIRYKCGTKAELAAMLAEQNIRLATASETISFSMIAQPLFSVFQKGIHVIGRGLDQPIFESSSYFGVGVSEDSNIRILVGDCQRASNGKQVLFLTTSNHIERFDGAWKFHGPTAGGMLTASFTSHQFAEEKIAGGVEFHDGKNAGSVNFHGKPDGERVEIALECKKGEDGGAAQEGKATLENKDGRLLWTTTAGATFPCRPDMTFPTSFVLSPE